MEAKIALEKWSRTLRNAYYCDDKLMKRWTQRFISLSFVWLIIIWPSYVLRTKIYCTVLLELNWQLISITTLGKQTRLLHKNTRLEAVSY